MTEALVSREAWLAARKALLVEEKELNAARDRLSAARRALPLVRVEKPYWFETEKGRKNLDQLFGDKRQLMVYHFMFGPGWDEGCKSCSLMMDGLDGLDVHLAARDVAFLCVSNGPLETLHAYRRRMGWRFDWVRAEEAAFSRDFGVTFENGEPGPAGGYNYTDRVFAEELPGISVFLQLEDGGVAHSYSTYGRGLDPLMGVYQLLDLAPIGRDEAALPVPMAWVRRRDQYEISPPASE